MLTEGRLILNSVSVFESVEECLTEEICRTAVARRDNDGGDWKVKWQFKTAEIGR